jgi:hypothetical protein
MMVRVRRALRGAPLLGAIFRGLAGLRRRARFPGSAAYWDRRYRSGGTSGAGSQGSAANFKAAVLNDFVEQHGIASVIEFGCGDGYQLGLAHYPRYVGLDVSEAAIHTCAELFAGDRTKAFLQYAPAAFVNPGVAFQAELGLSLDVVFHLVEDPTFELYMRHLFASAARFVVVYATNVELRSSEPHVRHRRFTDWIDREAPAWTLKMHVSNPAHAADEPEPLADFYLYERTTEA